MRCLRIYDFRLMKPEAAGADFHTGSAARCFEYDFSDVTRHRRDIFYFAGHILHVEGAARRRMLELLGTSRACSRDKCRV